MEVSRKPQGADEMGRVIVNIELKNHRDAIAVDLGQLAADKVRSVIMSGIVDTGAATMVIPKWAAKQLGLPMVDQVTVRYADQRRKKRFFVEDLEVHLLGRKGIHRAIVEPDREDALIGAIVLEDLDLIVDCKPQRLRPRSPNEMIFEIE